MKKDQLGLKMDSSRRLNRKQRGNLRKHMRLTSPVWIYGQTPQETHIPQNMELFL